MKKEKGYWKKSLAEDIKFMTSWIERLAKHKEKLRAQLKKLQA